MSRIETYVFLDMGFTGPINRVGDACWMPEITELSMLAVKRRHLFDIGPNKDPRVISKFQMCFKPVSEIVLEKSVEITGLNDFLLEQEAEFDQKAFNAMNAFIDCLAKPVCLIAHDGFIMHFTVLKYHFKNMNVQLPSDVMCADSILAFYDLKEGLRWGVFGYTKFGRDLMSGNIQDNEGVIAKKKSYLKLVRYPFYAPDTRTYDSYKLDDIYYRFVNDDPVLEDDQVGDDYRVGDDDRVGEDDRIGEGDRVGDDDQVGDDGRDLEDDRDVDDDLDVVYRRVPIDPKMAGNRCHLMMKIAHSIKGFERYVQENHCPFSEVPTAPSFEITTYKEDDSSEEETEVKDSSCEQKEDTSPSSRWFTVFNFFWPQF